METEQIIWKIFNRMRGTRRYDLTYFAEIAESEGIDITFDLLKAADSKLGARGGGFFPPEFVLKFISSYLNNASVNKIFDPWVKIGSLIIPLTEKLKPKSSVGYVKDKNNIGLIKSLQKDLDIKWEFEDINNVLGGKSKFDIIVGFPPWNLRPETIEFNLSNGEKISISDNVERLQMLKSLISLEDGGTGFFILNKGFLSNKNKPRDVLNNLDKFGIYVDAALEIPSGSFSYTNVPGDLVVFKKEEPDNLFIGELSLETSSNNSLLNNLKSRKTGKIPQLGVLQDLEQYKPLSYFINENEIRQMAKISGLSKIPLSDILIDVNMGRSGKDFDELSNSVYLPIIGNSDAVTSIDQLKIKAQNYAQLVIDKNKANAEFVASMYNTKLGKKVRMSMENYGVISKLNKETILDSEFYTTDVDTQLETIAVDSMLNEVFTQLDSHKNDLWKWPKANKNIRKSVELLNVGRRFDYWVQSLPYPLSSILLACKANSNMGTKVTYLLDFFEALSMFNTTIILSSITADSEFYNKHFLHCIENDEKNWLCRTSFTNWNIYGSCLAKKVRRLISDKETKELCLKLFGNPSNEFMNMITSTDIYNILKEVEECRNRWKGHGTIVNEETHKERFIILKSYLTKLRSKISFTYEDIFLILPGLMEFDGETYNGFCKEIKGSLPFGDIEVETINPLIKNNLYILHENQYEAVKLLPLIRIMPGPKTDTNACYFYSRYNLEKNEARFLSYHFEDDAEINLPDHELKSVFSIIRPKIEYS